MLEGRRADTGRRRQRVLAALAEAAKDGSETSVAAIARRAGVDRTFLYRHRDLLGQIHVQAAEPPTVPGGRGPAVSRASLQADLAAADARTARLAAHIRRLEGRLSEALGEQVWRESGIGGPDGTEQLQARITTLEQHVVDLELKIQDHVDDLDAARAANRELMAQLNRGRETPPSEESRSS
ncbi:TetR/AcrR family transcriptional regulator (plasmid) [Streptomyces sp. NBC_01724]